MARPVCRRRPETGGRHVHNGPLEGSKILSALLSARAKSSSSPFVKGFRMPAEGCRRHLDGRRQKSLEGGNRGEVRDGAGAKPMGIWLSSVIDSRGDTSGQMLGRRCEADFHRDGRVVVVDVVVAEPCSGCPGKLVALVLAKFPFCRTDTGLGSAGWFAVATRPWAS